MSDCDISAMGRHELEACTQTLLAERQEATRQRRLYNAAVAAFGVDSRMRLTQEECGELIAAINRFMRGRIGLLALALEIADVEIMCGQLRCIVDQRAVDAAKQAKLTRLEERVNRGADV